MITKIFSFITSLFSFAPKSNKSAYLLDHRPKVAKLKLTKDILIQNGIAKDKPDSRDKIKPNPEKVSLMSPSSTNDQFKIIITDTSLRAYAPDPYLYNQKNLNACGGFSGSAAMFILMHRMQSLSAGLNCDYEVPYFSPLWLYWYARDNDGFGATERDGGTTIRSVMKALHNPGVVEEKVWKQFGHSPLTKPDEKAQKANRVKIHNYFRIPLDKNAPQLVKDVLAIEQLPIIAGIYLYTEQMSKAYRTGIMEDVRNKDKAELIGGHAICITGYKQINDKTYLEFLNSWGPDFGDNGYGYFPIEWLHDDFYCIDAWTFDKQYF